MEKVYLVAGKRTAIGSFLGTLKDSNPTEFGAEVVKQLLVSANVKPENVDEVITGNILSAGLSQGPGRQVAIKAGLPETVCAYSLNMLCGSGMKAVMSAYDSIRSGRGRVIVAGGIESMSGSPLLMPASTRSGVKMGEVTLKDHMLYDALTDAFGGFHMGMTAENIAAKYGITREAQDEFAMQSQQKAAAAIDAGKFKDEIVPLTLKVKREEVVFDTDEYPNRKTSLDKLATLRPAFKKDGSVTAGNASGINDGASYVLLASESAVQEFNLKPLFEIVSLGQGGVDPTIMGMGPVPAIRDALQRANLKLSDMELLELNEAFAAQALGVVHELCEEHHVDRDALLQITNVNGGAIALGHPVGASGNRIITTLMHEMLKRKSNYGLASLCIGGGLGTAIIIKRV